MLRFFQSDDIRRSEENFSMVLTERDHVRLAFINENRAFTDGYNIVVDPAMNKLFTDKAAKNKIIKFLNIPSEAAKPWCALKLTTRAQNIHECLHIIYTLFPNPAISDPLATDRIRTRTLCLIYNIIEDAYIEAVGASRYNNLALYLAWGRASDYFASMPGEGTVRESFRQIGVTGGEEKETEEDAGKKEEPLLFEVLDIMAKELLYPIFQFTNPFPECGEYIDRIRPLYMKGSIRENPRERFGYARKIFLELENIIPEDSEEHYEEYWEYFGKLLGGNATHSAGQKSLQEYRSEGKAAKVSRRLFTDLDGNPIENGEIKEEADELSKAAEGEYKRLIDNDDGMPSVVYTFDELGATAFHRNIRAVENHPRPDTRLTAAYNNILRKYRSVINNANAKFAQILQTDISVVEEKKLFGSEISSSRLGDVKKRWWRTRHTDQGVPSLAILLLIDMSGSMWGARRDAAVVSSVILREVLAKQGISHAIVEHKAQYGQDDIVHNVLVDFGGMPSQRLNILRMQADGGTRDGISLLWAERYMQRKSTAENHVIITISDGVPDHVGTVSRYDYPASAKDSANVVSKITHRGTQIAAVAVEGCGDILREIYPQTVDCPDLSKLTSQLLRMISRLLQ